MAQQTTQRHLYRSRDSYLGGVCAGLAERFDMDPIVVRILFILLTLTTFGLMILVYLGLWLILPRAEESSSLYDVTPERAESSAFGSLDCAQPLHHMGGAGATGSSLVVRLAVAVAIMILFMIVAVNVTPLVSGASWWQFWPTLVLMIGVCLTVIPIGTNEAAWHAAGIVLMSAGASLLPISLGVIAWETIPYAFEQLWLFIAAIIVMFAVGYVRKVNALMVVAALCFAGFCLASLSIYSIPGSAETLTVLMPDGTALRIAFSLS